VTQCLISPLDDSAASTYDCELAGAGGLIASSLGWSTIRLLRCNGESVGVGGLINGGNTMLFLGMIDGGNTMLLLVGVGGLINGRDTTLLLLAGQRFG
jgi:hypothetical protein